MKEMIAAFLIWTVISLILLGIGILDWRSEKAVGFFTGVKPPEVTDIRKYNHTVAVLWFVFGYKTIEQAEYFQCGWFMFGVISQTLVIHTIRTHKLPFIGGQAGRELMFSTAAVVIITLILGLSRFAYVLDMNPLPYTYLFYLAGLMVVYLILAQIMKNIYIKRFKKWI